MRPTTSAGLSSEFCQAERQKLLGEMWKESILDDEDAKVEAGGGIDNTFCLWSRGSTRLGSRCPGGGVVPAPPDPPLGGHGAHELPLAGPGVQVQQEAVYYSTTTGMLHQKRGGGSERHLSDHGEVGMTPGQKALHMARQRMQISRTDAEMYQAVHTLALALGANRTEAGTHKALFAALVLLNRPEMSEEEVCASTGASLNSCKKWRRKVLDAQAGLPSL